MRLLIIDQHGAPTYAPDIAEAILTVARSLLARPNDNTLRGVFHLSSADLTPARRLAFSRLDGARLAAVQSVWLPDWRDGTGRCLDEGAAAGERNAT